MRHDNKFTYVAGQITGIADTEITYRPVLGFDKHEWTYEIRAGQVLDLTSLKKGKFYYIIGDDIGSRQPYHVWMEAHEVPKDTCAAFHAAHTSQENQYEPLPDYLKQGILELGRDGLNLWFIAQGENKGTVPSRADYVATLSLHKAKMNKRNQKKMALVELEMAHARVLNDLLEF